MLHRHLATLPACLAAALCSLALAAPCGAAAASFAPTRTDDPVPDGCLPTDCSLREAVIAANLAAGEDHVVLAPQARYELALPNLDPAEGEDEAASGDLDVTDPLTITQDGEEGRARLDANGIDRVLELLPGAGPVALSRLVITGGASPASLGPEHDGDGGGIRSEVDLELDHAIVRGNAAGSPSLPPDEGDGGGISLAGPAELVLTSSKVLENVGAVEGGGIDAERVRRLVLRRVKIERNQAESGGGLHYRPDDGAPAARLTRATLAANSAAGAAGGDGGGLRAVAGTVRVKESTFSENSAEGRGGGVLVGAGARLFAINATFAENLAAGGGGGIMAEDETSLNAVTIARNRADADADGDGQGGGILSQASFFEVENSLLALNRRGAGTADDCAGEPLDSGGDNLLTTRGEGAAACHGIDSAGDIRRPQPRIGRLGKHGGPTKTVPLRRHSPAIDEAGPLSSPLRDQRGVRRDREPDIGAFER